MDMEGAWTAQVGTENGYQYNGKELNEDFGLNVYHYGARIYDPAMGRFTGVDPISDKFPWVSTYNYAENRVPNAIDLHGLQSLNFNNYAFQYLQRRGNAMASQAKTQVDKRIPVVLNGGKNTLFGAISTFGAIVASPETAGGSLYALPMTVGEVGIGLSQIGNGLFGSADPNSPLHKSGSILGYAAYSSGVEHAGLIDALGQLAPGMFSGGNVPALFSELQRIPKLISQGKVTDFSISALSLYDGANDVANSFQQLSGTYNDLLISSDQGSKRFSSTGFKVEDFRINIVQESGERLTKKEIEDIKNFLTSNENEK